VSENLPDDDDVAERPEDAGEEPRPDPGEADPGQPAEQQDAVPAQDEPSVEEAAAPPQDELEIGPQPGEPQPEEPVEVGEEAAVEEGPGPEEAAEAEGVSTLDLEEPAPERVVEPEPPAEEPVAEEAPEEPVVRSADPFAGAGEWYVIHTYAGYENKVKTNLESRINTMQMQDKIFDVVIPMEDVMEIKGGRKQVVEKKVFPGYLLVKMVYDDDSWYVVRNTPGVTGFVSSGTGQKPTPLSRREVEKILAVKKEEVKPTFRLDFEEGDVVRIVSGPFADFNGTIDEINVDQSKVKVLVNIFDRETPVELSFDQVARV
jgi:transcription termination/antitermination protein NusG